MRDSHPTATASAPGAFYEPKKVCPRSCAVRASTGTLLYRIARGTRTNCWLPVTLTRIQYCHLLPATKNCCKSCWRCNASRRRATQRVRTTGAHTRMSCRNCVVRQDFCSRFGRYDMEAARAPSSNKIASAHRPNQADLDPSFSPPQG